MKQTGPAPPGVMSSFIPSPLSYPEEQNGRTKSLLRFIALYCAVGRDIRLHEGAVSGRCTNRVKEGRFMSPEQEK